MRVHLIAAVEGRTPTPTTGKTKCTTHRCSYAQKIATLLMACPRSRKTETTSSRHTPLRASTRIRLTKTATVAKTDVVVVCQTLTVEATPTITNSGAPRRRRTITGSLLSMLISSTASLRTSQPNVLTPAAKSVAPRKTLQISFRLAETTWSRSLLTLSNYQWRRERLRMTTLDSKT